MSEKEKKRKKAGDLTSGGLARRLFPREVRKKVKAEVEDKPPKSKKNTPEEDADSSIDGEDR